MADENQEERLKQALWFAVGKIADEESLRRNRNVTPQFIGALMELVWTQIEAVAQDLESFSRHAGRSTITTDDVLLLARRNEDLHGIIKDSIDKEKASKAKAKARRRDSLVAQENGSIAEKHVDASDWEQACGFTIYGFLRVF
ncbi:hypothetical protein PG994_008775 [Apiospora phragmitis]|uniref:Centromere protein S n=1 Tax=Apiospora phragmitis TaxID=2905665 RepID=A0ABR1UHZ4_9PEZI